MAVLTLALIVDLLIGDPKSLWQRLPHPVALFGKVIDLFDQYRSVLKFDHLGEEDGNEPGFIAGIILLGALLLISAFYRGNCEFCICAFLATRNGF